METFQTLKSLEKEDSITQTIENDTTSIDSPIVDQVSKFDTTYSDDKIKELTNEFDSITIDEDVLKSVTTTKDNAMVANASITFRMKLLMATTIAVKAMLLFLAIYNIVCISATASSIQILESNIATETTIVDSLKKDLSSLNDTTGISSELESNGYTTIDDDKIIYVELNNTNTVTRLQGSTNWFDAVCNFISSIFGG